MAGTTGRSGPLWVRAVVVGVVAQVLLFAGYFSLAPLAPSMNIMLVTLVATSILLYVAGGYWAARPACGGAVVTGALVGLAGVASYLVFVAYESATGQMNAMGTGPVVFADAFNPVNSFDHALKVVSGALGGFIAARRMRAGSRNSLS